MLLPIREQKRQSHGGRFIIIASQYNARYVNSMVAAAKRELKRAGAKNINIIRVPGAFEIPVVASRLARMAVEEPRITVLICLGVILRGQTSHAAHIGEAVSRALMQIQIRFEIPVIHEVLLLENEDQARVRCLGRQHNRGREAAQTALAMAKVMRQT
jgi:6,7-dimethyl-8-ribityllumazine synthase